MDASRRFVLCFILPHRFSLSTYAYRLVVIGICCVQHRWRASGLRPPHAYSPGVLSDDHRIGLGPHNSVWFDFDSAKGEGCCPHPVYRLLHIAAAACSLCDEFITVINPGWPDVIHAQTYIRLLKSVAGDLSLAVWWGVVLPRWDYPANLYYDTVRLLCQSFVSGWGWQVWGWLCQPVVSNL